MFIQGIKDIFKTCWTILNCSFDVGGFSICLWQIFVASIIITLLSYALTRIFE